MYSQIESLLRTDHVELDGLLTNVFGALDSSDSDGVHRALDLFWARLAMHIRAEHLRLFPAIVSVANQRSEFVHVHDVIANLRHDHDFFMRELAFAIKLVRAGENDPLATVREILNRVRDRLSVHDHIEENRIYTVAATGLMTPETVARLHSSIQTELGSLPPRFGTEG